jgi:RNA polymerase sigma factor (sigma-70 family)
MLDNEKLIKLCQKGSNKAFDELLGIYSDLLYGICMRYSKCNEDEASDIFQEVCIKLFNNICTYKFQGSFEGWIRRLTVNTAINYLKKKNTVFFNDYDIENESLLNYSDSDYYENALNSLSAKEIIALINEMPEGYRTVFNLHVIEGYKHVEIAEILNITDNTSRSQFKKARNLLIKKIEKLR